MGQTLWIARNDYGINSYRIFPAEPHKNKHGIFLSQQFDTRMNAYFLEEHMSLLKLKPGEKKQFIINVERE